MILDTGKKYLTFKPQARISAGLWLNGGVLDWAVPPSWLAKRQTFVWWRCGRTRIDRIGELRNHIVEI